MIYYNDTDRYVNHIKRNKSTKYSEKLLKEERGKKRDNYNDLTPD